MILICAALAAVGVASITIVVGEVLIRIAEVGEAVLEDADGSP